MNKVSELAAVTPRIDCTPADASTSITITVEPIELTYTVDELWPDGDAPEPPTAGRVVELIRTRRLEPLADAPIVLTVRVNTPNPAHQADVEPLFPDHEPPARLVTRAQHRL